MQSFTFSDGKTFRGILTKARINREEVRDVIILSCNRQDARVFAEYDRSLRLNEALLRIFSDRHPQLGEDQVVSRYNAWEPSAEDLEEATFIVDNRILRTNGVREIVNGDTHVYYSARLTRGNNGMPTFVPFVPREREQSESRVMDAIPAMPDF